MLRDLLVSNAGLHEAIGKSARVAPAAIRDEVRALYVRTQRGDLSSALIRFADELDDSIADTVVTALLIADQRAVADLGEMLAAVATSTRDTVAMQLRINAARARTYRTAQLIAGIVAFFVGLMIVTNRDYMDPFGTFVGQFVLTAVAVIVAARGLGHDRALAPAVPARLLKVAVHPSRRAIGDLGRRAGRRARGRGLPARARRDPAGPTAAHPVRGAPRAARHGRAASRGTAEAKRWTERLAPRLDAGHSARLVADLDVLGRSATRHTVDQLGYAVVFTGLAVVAAIVALPLLRVPGAGAVRRRRLVLSASPVVYPDLEVRSRARRRAGRGPR